MKEVWKDIEGYERFYQVSNIGRVKSLDRQVRHYMGGVRLVKGKILKSTPNIWGYLQVMLSKNGNHKTRTIHQLVAVAFHNHCPAGHSIVVDHIDGNRRNNLASNLQLITQRENIVKSKRCKGGSSEYVGVHWVEGLKKWKASITINGKTYYLGVFSSELDASNAYNAKLNQIL